MGDRDAPQPSETTWKEPLSRGASFAEGAPHWPAGVRPISIDGLGLMGVSGEGLLHWDGRPVEVRRRLDLSKGERFFAILVGAFTIAGSIGAAAQGWAAGHQWMCQAQVVSKWCPPPSTSR
ncbi:MAG: hypothetical protein ACAH20_19905 [Methylobacteriaceae bacterium]|jgi:hypothetical protein|uniref:Uncharacterized protein n=3 Tax=Methylorubrum TaxID=2282523 RepID=B7KPD7_METC4|nr:MULTISPECIES: hypothetical protein [Methylorubrum]ACK82020.1 hypothetical protein Mchl_1126 [Methylorubrum extorquens CM4]WHQ71086.1 hypothetical protein KEC54_05720 [Methylorubrum extorquens]GEL44596.1 hypothetical protein MEX01_51870 [Methylorubrum extorquens]